MWHREFRERQVQADLQRIATSEAVPDPWITVFAPGVAPETRAAATSVLLQFILETGAPDPAAEDLFRNFKQDFLNQPAPVRAALMNGFDQLCQRGFAPETCRPAPVDRLTHPRAVVEQALIALARQMTPAEIDHIARADYGCDVARHHAALLTLLADPDVAYPPGEVWYPAEVVELVSHVPGTTGHVPCLAVVLLDALRTGDPQANAEFRLAQQVTTILALPLPSRSVLLAAFRHLYEAERAWNPAVPAAGLSIDQMTLPWVTLP